MSNNFKRKLSAFAAMLALVSISSVAMAATDGNDISVIRGTSNTSVKTSTDQLRTDINFKKGAGSGAVGQIDFKKFNVGSKGHVNYGFTGVSQTMINRVLGGEKSKIAGKITSSCAAEGCSNYENTGKVVFINPAGVMFDKGSTVDLNSFTVSTFDFKGAKNLGNMTDKELKAYEAGLTKYSPTAEVNGTANDYGTFEFDSKAIDEFRAAGVDMDSLSGNTKIELNGTHFNHFDKTTNENDVNTKVADLNTNKSTVFISDNVDYKDSLIKTGDNHNYNDFDQSFGNVRIVTTDGVSFRYLGNGYTDKYTVAQEDANKSVQRTISIDNSGLNADKAGIDTGNVAIINNSNAAGSTIKIKDSYIKAKKMVDGENGIVRIQGDDNIEIKGSRIDTVNTSLIKNGKEIKNTLDKDENGNIEINAAKNLKITDSVITTAGSKASSAGDATVQLTGQNGSVDMNNSKVVSSGNVNVNANNDKVSLDNSLIYAKNSLNESAKKNINIVGNKNVNANDSLIVASGNVNMMASDANGNVSGDITITSKPKNGENQTLIIAGDDLSIESKNTTIDNASLAYKNIKFHDKNTKGLNNVTVKNDSTFTQSLDGETSTGNVKLETNGNFTMDKATMRSAGVKYDIADDNKTADAFDFTVDITPATAVNVDITSSEGNVTVQNASDIKATNDINMTATKGSYTQTGSDLKAGNDVNITANKDVEVVGGINRQPDIEGGIFIYEGISAGKDVNIQSKNGNYIQDSAEVQANRDVNINAKNDVNMTYSSVDSNNDVNIDAGKNINLSNNGRSHGVRIEAKNDVKATAGGKINVEKSDINAITNNATLIANGEGDNGNINITNGSKVEAGNDVTVKSTKGNEVNIDNSKVNAGSDKDGFDKVKDSGDTIGDATIEATSGYVNIKNNSTVTSEDKNVNIIASKDINFANKDKQPVNIDKSSTIKGENNVKIQSTGGSIRGEKTQMPEIEYGNRLEFNAKGNNIFTSDDSLKSVNVDFVAGEGNKFYTEKDIQFVNSSLESPNNFVESGKDVILNNLTIKQATANPEDTKTQIFANGNVTTDNVTNEDLTAKGGTFPQSVSTDRTGTGKTVLDVNQTKVTIQTDTVKDPTNPDNGSITIDVKNANNPKAGLELTAQNVKALDNDSTDGDFRTGYYKSGESKWDKNIEPKEGPEVHLNAVDDEVAIKDIDTDKLTLDSKDTFIADNTDGTPVIEVKDKEGFNLDPHENYDDGDPNGYTYTENIQEGDLDEQGGKLEFGPWSDYELIDSYVDDKGVTHNIYQSTRDGKITDKITTQHDKMHTITFDNDGNPTDFKLIYDKTKVTTEPGYPITAEEVIDDPSKIPSGHDINEFVDTDERTCDPVPPINPVFDSYIDQITLPREQVEVSKTSTVADGTADQTSSIMSAAAKVNVTEGDAAAAEPIDTDTSNNDDDKDELEY